MRTVNAIGITGLLWFAAAPAAGQTCNSAEPATQNCGSPRVIPGWAGHHVVLVDASTAIGVENRCQTLIFRTLNLEFCGGFDTDEDGDMDLFDFGAFQDDFTGVLP